MFLMPLQSDGCINWDIGGSKNTVGYMVIAMSRKMLYITGNWYFCQHGMKLREGCGCG